MGQFDDPDEYQRKRWLAFDHHQPAHVHLSLLLPGNEPYVRVCVLENPGVPDAMLLPWVNPTGFPDDEVLRYRTAIAENPGCGPDVLRALVAATDNPRVLTLVAEHPNVTRDILEAVVAAGEASGSNSLTERARTHTLLGGPGNVGERRRTDLAAQRVRADRAAADWPPIRRRLHQALDVLVGQNPLDDDNAPIEVKLAAQRLWDVYANRLGAIVPTGHLVGALDAITWDDVVGFWRRQDLPVDVATAEQQVSPITNWRKTAAYDMEKWPEIVEVARMFADAVLERT